MGLSQEGTGCSISCGPLQEQDGRRSERTSCSYSFLSFLQLKICSMPRHHILGRTSYTLPLAYWSFCLTCLRTGEVPMSFHILPPPPKCWNERCAPPCPDQSLFLKNHSQSSWKTHAHDDGFNTEILGTAEWAGGWHWSDSRAVHALRACHPSSTSACLALGCRIFIVLAFGYLCMCVDS